MTEDCENNSDEKIDISGIPAGHRVKRKYTMSEQAIEARRQSALKSTGPSSPEGKRASSKNAWKHGSYAQSFILGRLGKPCQTTCDKFPCELVDDGEVRPGQNCLDKSFVAESFDAIIKSVELKQHTDFNELAALELAGALQILREAKEHILNEGVIVKTEKVDKEGKFIGWEYVPHPAWFTYTKMLSDLGLSFTDFLMTPKSIAKAEKGATEEEVDTLASVLSRVARNIASGRKDADK